ncbi:hypothetical protein RRG08_033930, partial [Elysia crispata]
KGKITSTCTNLEFRARGGDGLRLDILEGMGWRQNARQEKFGWKDRRYGERSKTVAKYLCKIRTTVLASAVTRAGGMDRHGKPKHTVVHRLWGPKPWLQSLRPRHRSVNQPGSVHGLVLNLRLLLSVVRVPPPRFWSNDYVFSPTSNARPT